MRENQNHAMILVVLLALVLSAIISVRGDIAGIVLYRVLSQSDVGWGYMSPAGAGAHNGSWGNEWSASEAKVQAAGTHVFPLSGTYTIYDPDLVITQPTTTPEAFTGTGEPQYWSWFYPNQIP